MPVRRKRCRVRMGSRTPRDGQSPPMAAERFRATLVTPDREELVMSSPLGALVAAQLVAERQRRLMDEADARRRTNTVRAARPARPAKRSSGPVLRYATRLLERLA